MRTTETIEVRVNGEPREIERGTTIADLLDTLGLHPRLVVVEHNREILARDRLAAVTLEAGDGLEIVHFVGGG